MAGAKETKMVLKVNLQCYKCYRKIKEVLCCCPQIRDQVYDEKKNTVMITVVCCSPEHIKQKIARKAGNILEGIEIVPAPALATKPPAPARVPPPTVPDPGPVVMGSPRLPPPGPVPMYPVGVRCCCYEGGPCYHGRGPMCSDGCGRPSYQCSGGNRGYYVSHWTEYFSEDNTSGCSVL